MYTTVEAHGKYSTVENKLGTDAASMAANTVCITLLI